MNELPISKFAPFDKCQATFQWEVSNKLKELNVNCKNCIYAKPTEKKDSAVLLEANTEDTITNNFYNCSLLYATDNLVDEYSLCRFFTNIEEIEDTTEEIEEGTKNPDQEMSLAIQKLDFSNSEIYNKIKDLRDHIINE
jgi:hypothetical protein